MVNRGAGRRGLSASRSSQLLNNIAFNVEFAPEEAALSGKGGANG